MAAAAMICMTHGTALQAPPAAAGFRACTASAGMPSACMLLKQPAFAFRMQLSNPREVSGHIVGAVCIGLAAAVLDYLWPRVCYRFGLIDRTDPPPALTGEGADMTAGSASNPYFDAAGASKLVGHVLVLVRFVNMVFVAPASEAYFFLRFCVSYITVAEAQVGLDLRSGGPLSAQPGFNLTRQDETAPGSSSSSFALRFVSSRLVRGCTNVSFKTAYLPLLLKTISDPQGDSGVSV